MDTARIIGTGALRVAGALLLSILAGLVGLLTSLPKLLVPSSKGFVEYFGLAALAGLCFYIAIGITELKHNTDYWWLIAGMGLVAMQCAVYGKAKWAASIVAIALLCCFANKLLTDKSIEAVQNAIANSFGPLSGNAALIATMVMFAVIAGFLIVGSLTFARDVRGAITGKAPEKQGVGQ
jgi:hypothetical protein